MGKAIVFTIILYIFAVLSGSAVWAQSVKGRVIDPQYQPAGGVQVLIAQLGISVTTDSNGEFSISTDSVGTYTFFFLHPSYKEEVKKIDIPSFGNNIQLNAKTDRETSAISSEKNNDLGYEIMKRAIRLAPLYKDYLLSYKSEVYIKGTMKIIRISSIMRSISKEDELNPTIKEGDIFTQESINDISFEKNKYIQTSKPISNTFPKDFDLKLSLTNYNIYDTDNDLISPLSDQALDYYNFVYEGTTVENNSLINRIKIYPKQSIDKTFAGYLYISSDDWHVNRLELINLNSGVKTSFRQIYEKLEDKTWVVSSSDLDLEVSILGNQVEANYVSKLTYKNFIVNNDIQNKLLAIDLSSLAIDKHLYKLENEDSSWKIPKSISLTNTKTVGNKYVDNFQKIIEKTNISLKKRPFWLRLLLGNTYKIDSTLTIGYGGLINPLYVGYNLVDGWSYKQTLNFTKKIDQKILQTGLTAQYSFDRKHFMFDVDSKFLYHPENHGLIALSGGIFSADFNNSTGINNFENSLSSLFLRENYINFYESRYLSINHSIDLTEHLNAYASIGYYSRIQLDNILGYSLFYKRTRQFRDNIPMNNNIARSSFLSNENNLFSDYKASIFTLRLTYSPGYYAKSNEMLHSTSSDFPSVIFTWHKGLRNIFNSTSDFDHMEIAFKQYVKLDDTKSYQYLISAGYFPNNNSIHFSDFKHFNIKEFDFMLTSFDQSYNLLKVYQPSTNKWYFSSFNKYSTDRLFLKQLPVLNKINMRESMFISYLITPDLKNYLEMGYSVSNIINFTNIGVFVGFDDFRYNGVGIKVSFNVAN